MMFKSCHVRVFFVPIYFGLRLWLFPGNKTALDNQFLLNKDVYPTNMPLALKFLEKFKTEAGTTPKGRADSGDESGVAFAQAQSWAQIMV